MATGSQDRKLPPSIAYPFIATNIVLVITVLISLSHRFQGWMMASFGLLVAVCDIGLAIVMFVWLRRDGRQSRR